MSMTPTVRVKSDKSITAILIELPGCSKEDTEISIKLDRNIYGAEYGLLSISAKTNDKSPEKREYECLIDISGYSSNDEYEATMSCGLLEILIDKKVNSRSIPIK